MLKLCSFSEFDEVIKDKRLFLIGAGKRSVTLLQKYGWNVFSCIDNDESKNGTFLNVNNTQIPVHNWNYLLDNVSANTILLVTPVAFESLLKKIESETNLCDIDCYISSYMAALQWDLDRIEVSKVHYEITKGIKPKIPKIIHYFWFSGDPYPEKVQKCIDSWHKFCPDYEFKKWDLTNYKPDCQYAKDALAHKCWAVASDYGRADVVYRYGGIYLDTDVELIKPLDDLLYDDAFIGFESPEYVDPGSGFGAVKGNPVIERFRSIYYDEKFLLEDGSLNKIVCPPYYTKKLIDIGLRQDGSFQRLDNIVVYPPLVLCPHSYVTDKIYLSDKTYSIHHHLAGWYSKEQKENAERRYSFFKKGEETRV